MTNNRKNEENRLTLIPKAEKYIEYMVSAQ